MLLLRRGGRHGFAGGLGDASDGVVVDGAVGGLEGVGGLAVQDDLGLLEVAPGVLVYQHQAQVVARRELLVDVPERRRQVEAAQEQPDRDRLAARGGAVHDLFVVRCAGLLAEGEVIK